MNSEMPGRVQQLNETPPKQSKASRFAEKVVLPVVMWVASVIFALQFFEPIPSADMSCEDAAAKIAEHRTVIAQGGQQ